ncbi:hypothetical protein [Brevibacillus formosus]|uniref:hypothetical protein n=1 Tax=Brevibacillus formosus TaxID=54913 RepID=UPI003F1DA1DE
MNKKWLKPAVTLTAAVAVLSSVYLASDTLAVKSHKPDNNKGDYLLAESNFEVPNSKVEYIKVSFENGGYEEHWRDIANQQERHDTYSKTGELVNSVIVTDSGKKVISIGNDNGELTAYTWELPSKDAKENKKMLQNSLLKEETAKLQDKRWNKQKSKTLNDTSIDVIETTYDRFKEVVDLDTSTGLPIEREVYSLNNGKETKLRTETFELVDSSSDLFEIDQDLEITEVTADDTKKKN